MPKTGGLPISLYPEVGAEGAAPSASGDLPPTTIIKRRPSLEVAPGNFGRRDWIRTSDLQYPKLTGTAKLPYAAMVRTGGFAPPNQSFLAIEVC